jgi:hypothetical protein
MGGKAKMSTLLDGSGSDGGIIDEKWTNNSGIAGKKEWVSWNIKTNYPDIPAEQPLSEDSHSPALQKQPR